MKVIGLGLLAVLSAIPAASQATHPCEPNPAVRRALNDTPNLYDFRTPLETRMQPLRALLAKYPRDLFIQQRYQDSFRGRLYLYQEYDRAFAMYRGKPDDPVFRYLEARLTGTFDAEKAEAMLTDLIAKEPAFPWPHLAIAELTARTGSRDAKKAETHVRAFIAACPSSVEGYAMLRAVEDPEMIRSGAAKLRSLLEARADYVSLPYWRPLWDLELRAAAKGEEEAARQRVLADSAVLRKLAPVLAVDWNNTLRYAAQLTKDPTLSTWLDDTILERFPGSYFAVNIERERWARAHPRPGRNAPPEEQRKFAELEKTWTEELARRYPEDFNVQFDRYQSLQSSTVERPIEERLAIIDAYEALLRRSPDASSSVPPRPIRDADLYVKWRARLDRVPSMVQAGLEEIELQTKYRIAPGMAPPEMRSRMTDQTAMTYWRALLVLADLYLYEKKAAQASDVIGQGIANVELRPFYSLDTDLGKRDAASRRRDWLVRQARLAELEGKPQEALALYQQFTRQMSKASLANPQNVYQDLRDAVADAKRAYLASGGKEESWLEWAASVPAGEPPMPPAPALAYPNTVPDFQARDLGGKTWSLAGLKGKATLIDVWATWCGPCRGAHPRLQELYDKIKDRKDIQILTFSVDETAYLPATYVKDAKYTFPVIASKDITEKLFPVAMGLPQYWIVDAQGRRSSPFSLGSPERMIAELEKAAAAK